MHVLLFHSFRHNSLRLSVSGNSYSSYGGGGRSSDSRRITSPNPPQSSSGSRSSRWDRKSPTGSVGSGVSRSSTGRAERSRSRSRDRDRHGSEHSSPRTPAQFSEDSNTGSEVRARKKPRRSRWGDEKQKTSIPGMPTILPSSLTEEQRKIYVCKSNTVLL